MQQNDFYNEPPQREPIFNIPSIVVVLVSACLISFVWPTYFMPPEREIVFVAKYGFIPLRLSLDPSVGAILSIITYSFMHGSWAHIILNMMALVVFGSPLANRLGTPAFLLFWVYTAMTSALFYYLFNSASSIPMIGASGALSGMMGAAARYGFGSAPREPYREGASFGRGDILPMRIALQSRTVLTFIGIWLLANLGIGFLEYLPNTPSSYIAWEAHVGGLIAGFLGIGLFDRYRR